MDHKTKVTNRMDFDKQNHDLEKRFGDGEPDFLNQAETLNEETYLIRGIGV